MTSVDEHVYYTVLGHAVDINMNDMCSLIEFAIRLRVEIAYWKAKDMRKVMTLSKELDKINHVLAERELLGDIDV